MVKNNEKKKYNSKRFNVKKIQKKIEKKIEKYPWGHVSKGEKKCPLYQFRVSLSM